MTPTAQPRASAAIAIAAALMLLTLLPPAQPAAGAGADARPVGVNVVKAWDRGCSNDGGFFSGNADLRVTIHMDGELVHRTPKAQDRGSPYYASFATVAHLKPPVEVRVSAHEAEPSGFFGTGTSWTTCDASPGEATAHTFSWQGEAREIHVRGDGERAVELVVVVGTTYPDPPQPRVARVGVHNATIAWDGAPAGGVTSHRLRWGALGPFMAEGGGGDGALDVTGLCDNAEYRLTLVRDADPWHVPGGVTVATLNVPPEPPRLLRADVENGTLRAAWESETTHDVRRFELHLGAAPDFAATNATRWATTDGRDLTEPFQPFRLSVDNVSAAATHARVRLVDEGGLHADSDAFPLDGPRREPSPLSAPRFSTCDWSSGPPETPRNAPPALWPRDGDGGGATDATQDGDDGGERVDDAAEEGATEAAAGGRDAPDGSTGDAAEKSATDGPGAQAAGERQGRGMGSGLILGLVAGFALAALLLSVVALRGQR